MNWNDFKENVERWAEERGIYEHSTPEAQLLKALSELGELADAVIKNDRDALKDAIGDVAVCLVNYGKMNGMSLEHPMFDPSENINVASVIGELSHAIGLKLIGGTQGEFEVQYMVCCLVGISQRKNLVFLECCAAAWQEIKDRKGRMVAGGAFVKDN